MGGRERYAFVPFDGIAATAPKGAFRHVQDTAISIKDGKVYLEYWGGGGGGVVACPSPPLPPPPPPPPPP
jgi:hypothetical protein